MIKVLLRETIEKRLEKIGWQYIAPEFPLINDTYRFIFKNPNGKEIEFGFNEICHWLYDEDYIGCGHDCDVCLTPIC